jgi:predicted ATP-grasp superfamily ATP-dependent carboligase
VKVVIIFSGSNQRAVISFLRYAKGKNITFGIIANGEKDPIYDTEYAKNVFLERDYNSLCLKDILSHCNQAKELFRAEEIFIVPTTEYLNRFLIENEQILHSNNIAFGLSSEALYKTISDKESFANLCLEYGISVPLSYDLPPDNIPFVCKPKKYLDKKKNVNPKPIIIENEKERETRLKNIDLSNFFFQDYVQGKSIYLLFYFDRNQNYSVFSQENLIQQHGGGSMLLAKSSLYHKDEKLVNPFINLFKKEKFQGLVMVEVKYSKDDYYMIEANPRLWGPSQLILDSNMTLFDHFCLDNHLTNEKNFMPEIYLPETIYFWSGGLRENKTKDLMIHDYDLTSFVRDFSKYISNEVYLKEDAITIFLKENQ